MTQAMRFTSRRNLAWRRVMVTAPIMMISVYNLVDIAKGNNGIFLEAEVPPAPLLTKNQMIDIISVGSLLKESFQDAQQRTFGSHPSVRNFYRVTEMSDTDRECFTDLTTDQMREIINFCSVGDGRTIPGMFRKNLFQPKKQAGWICAQKRPIDGLFHVLQQYRDGLEVPEYLFIIDDDTYVNMDSLTDTLHNEFPFQTPQLVAGCNFVFLKHNSFTFPYGGFGSFLSKAAINRLLQPIDCSTREARSGRLLDHFSRLACSRLGQNLMGENIFFEDGMSVADLMFKFASEQPYALVGNWTAGYCFHSDHALAYFMNFYHIAVPEQEIEGDFKLSDNFRKKFSYTALTNENSAGRQGECNNERELCNVHSQVCHYIQPDQMDKLFREKQHLAPDTALVKSLS